MKKLMDKLMLSCKRACELIDKKSIVKLSVKEKMMLHMHASMCDACAVYKKQSKILDALLQKHMHSKGEAQIPHIINNKLKQQIISKL